MLLSITSCVRTKTIHVPISPEPCRVGKYPPGYTLMGITEGCPDGFVCITVNSAIAIALTKADADRFYRDVTACPYVQISDDPLGTALDRWIAAQKNN